MRTANEIEKAQRDATDCPTAWFVMLEHARNINDFEAAAEAVRQLKRLGVTVRFDRRSKAGVR